jgi:hypothetical protein
MTKLTVTDHAGRVTQTATYNESLPTIFKRADPFSRMSALPCWLTWAEFDHHVIRQEPWN